MTPTALWALLALAIPLLIHLFNRSRGRLVRIGNIDLIRQARKLQVTEVRLTQWLLLLLRLAIFTLAALILAGLATAGLDSSNANTTYLTPGWVRTSGPADLETVMRTAAEAEDDRVFLLQPGFPRVDDKSLTPAGPAPMTVFEDNGNTWSLLAERLSLERHLGQVTVYATDRLLQYGHVKPALPRDVTWHISHPQTLAGPDDKPLSVLIQYDPDRASDVPVLHAALAALRENRLPGLVWESTPPDRTRNPQAAPDWLIRLAGGEPDLARFADAEQPAVMFLDGDDDGVEFTDQFIDLPFYPFSRFRLNRYNPSAGFEAGKHGVTGGRILLSTSDGRPLLQEFHSGRTRILQFNSRIDPRWSSLALQPEFPELLLQLMTDPGQDILRFADARINPANLQSTAQRPEADIPMPRRSMQGILAALLLTLWVMERWLSERKPGEKR